MDPIASLAGGAVVALAPYLAEPGKGFAKEAGKSAAGKIDALHQALKTRFEDKPAAKEALADLEFNPENEDVQAALRRQLTKQMSSDPTLVDILKQLMAEIKEDKASISFLTQVYDGEVGEIINAGKLEGGIHIDKRIGKM
jgi:hypothetical protein